jgi:hypothetical protein
VRFSDQKSKDQGLLIENFLIQLWPLIKLTAGHNVLGAAVNVTDGVYV